MTKEWIRNAAYFVCILAGVALLLAAVDPSVLPSRPKEYASTHPVSTVQPIMGFSADSVFNTGTAEELDAFPDIGEVYAQRIIEGRSILGNYQLPTDLLLVKGIGEKRLAGMMAVLTEELVEIPLSTE